MTVCTSGHDSAIRLIAEMPSIPGSRTSLRAQLVASVDNAFAVFDRPDQLQVGNLSEHEA
jgi:hypothetical protein